MRSKVTIQPLLEPVTVDQVKASLRITDSAEDALIQQYIVDARGLAENYTSRKFINQTLVGYADGFCNGKDIWWSGTRVASESYIYGQSGGFIELDWSPISSVTSVHSIDINNTESLYSSSNYYLDNYDNDLKSKIVLNDTNFETVTSLRSSNAFKITYVAGYGDQETSVPASIRRGIILMASHLYSNRGDCGEDCAKKSGANIYLDEFKIESL